MGKKASGAIFVCTSGFTENARKYAKKVSIELIDLDDIIALNLKASRGIDRSKDYEKELRLAPNVEFTDRWSSNFIQNLIYLYVKQGYEVVQVPKSLTSPEHIRLRRDNKISFLHVIDGVDWTPPCVHKKKPAEQQCHPEPDEMIFVFAENIETEFSLSEFSEDVLGLSILDIEEMENKVLESCRDTYYESPEPTILVNYFIP